MPVAIRIPLTGLLVGGSTGVRIATGLATLAMTCGSLDRCAFAETPCGNEQGTARTVREAGPYHFRRTWWGSATHMHAGGAFSDPRVQNDQFPLLFSRLFIIILY